MIAEIQTALNSVIAPTINGFLNNTAGNTNLYETLDLDWSMVDGSPKINGYDLELGVKGLFHPEGDSWEPAIPPPFMPFIDHANAAKFQSYISTYTINSLGNAAVKSLKPNFVVTHDVVPAASPFQLITASMDALFPGLAAKYGPYQDMDVNIILTGADNFVSVPET